jgi:tetratricopeptide (TPR) repeat protein
MISISGVIDSGRTALLEEVAQRVLVRGGHVIRWDGQNVAALFDALPAGTRTALRTGRTLPEAMGVSGAGERIREESRSRFVLIVVDPPDDADPDAANSLARYLNGVALESDAPLDALILKTAPADTSPTGEFEDVIALPKLDTKGVQTVIEGFLGKCDLERALVERIAAATAGIPGRVVRTTLELISKGVLGRRDGTWRFIEKEQIRDLQVGSVAEQLGETWQALSPGERDLLTALCLAPSGFAAKALSGLLGDSESNAKTRLESLRLRGLVAEQRAVWSPPSWAVRSAIDRAAEIERKRSVAARLLESRAEDLGEEAEAALEAIASENEEKALRAARLAADRRDYLLAESRALLAGDWSRTHGNRSQEREAVLLRAECLHRVGRHEAVRDLLQDEETWRDLPDTEPIVAEQKFLLGRALHAVGDLAAARTAFAEVIRLANVESQAEIVLGANGELAEIEWRYEDAHSREQAIRRLEGILDSTRAREDLAEQRASLVYQLGAALIELGRRDDARRTLEGGLAIRCGAYWRMRMRNALATILYYHGDFPGSLELLNAAWRDAEGNSIDNFKARILSNRAGIYYATGRFAESVEQHALTMSWARKTGSNFEYLAGCLGETINLAHLARYEPAISRAREAREVAAALPNLHEVAKAFELEALITHVIGDDVSASALLQEANAILEGRGFDDVRPRLDWLGARIAGRQGDFARSETLLRRALDVLKEAPDWEDLPGVQIELDRLAWRRGDAGATSDGIREATVKAEADGAVIVAIRGGLVLSEILADHGIDDADLEALALRGLALAEQSGTREFVWRISSGLGRLALRRGNREMAQQRLSLSLRVLREIASDLAASHRQFYLATPHARTLLAALESR